MKLNRNFGPVDVMCVIVISYSVCLRSVMTSGCAAAHLMLDTRGGGMAMATVANIIFVFIYRELFFIIPS